MGIIINYNRLTHLDFVNILAFIIYIMALCTVFKDEVWVCILKEKIASDVENRFGKKRKVHAVVL